MTNFEKQAWGYSRKRPDTTNRKFATSHLEVGAVLVTWFVQPSTIFDSGFPHLEKPQALQLRATVVLTSIDTTLQPLDPM